MRLQKDQIKKISMLIVILLLATIIRFYRITEVPEGFFTDEAAIGLNAYTFLHNATGIDNMPHLLFFPAFGTYNSPWSIYMKVPFIALFGLTEFAIRFASALFGVLGVFTIYLLTKELFIRHKQSENIALLSAFFLAIAPWHIHMSRIGWESITPFIALMSLSVWCFLKALKNPRALPISVTLFAITTYNYFPARLFVPAMGLGIFILFFKFFKRYKRITLISAAILLLVLIPLLYHYFSDNGSWGRWNQVSIFVHPPQDESIGRHILRNYASHFSPGFLFIDGDIGMPEQHVTRHSIRGMGQLYLFQLPLLIIGLVALVQKKYRTVLPIVAVWLIFYPFGSAVTIDRYAQATRSAIGVVPFQIITVFGLVTLLSFFWNHQKKTIRRIGTCITILSASIIVFSAGHYANAYFIEYPTYSSDYWGWQYGARDIVKYFVSVEHEYNQLIMQPQFNGPEMLIDFYSQNRELGCTKCIVGGLDKYNTQKKQLFAIQPGTKEYERLNGSMIVKKTITYPSNGKVAFEIGEISLPQPINGDTRTAVD